MNKTTSGTKKLENNERLLVDTPTLMDMLQSGRKTATDIGIAANARVNFGKRVLWKVSRINEYLESVAK